MLSRFDTYLGRTKMSRNVSESDLSPKEYFQYTTYMVQGTFMFSFNFFIVVAIFWSDVHAPEEGVWDHLRFGTG